MINETIIQLNSHELEVELELNKRLFMRFKIDYLPGNCGALLLNNFSYHEETIKMLQENKLEICQLMLELFNEYLVIRTFDHKNIFIATDTQTGFICNLFNILTPGKNWSKESFLGINDNTKNNLVVRHVSTEELGEAIQFYKNKI